MSNPVFRITSSEVSKLARELMATQQYSLDQFCDALVEAIVNHIGQDDNGTRALAVLLTHTYLEGWTDRNLAAPPAVPGFPIPPAGHYRKDADSPWIHRDKATPEDRAGEFAILWPDTLVRWV